MARSPFSPSPSPPSPAPSFSSTSSYEHPHQVPNSNPSNTSFFDPGSISRPNSPEEPESDTVACLWEGCGVIFDHLPSLIEHIHNDHIGVHKSNYTCEWATCSRRGLAQTSRFALISHIRSHTGEKPFTCPRPECDKSFTRSDALAKHMRLQHNISPPLPGRGGNRKRKRDESVQPPPQEATELPVSSAPPPPASSTNPPNSFNTFKIEPQTPSSIPSDPGADDYFSTNGHHPPSPPPRLTSPSTLSDTSDALPDHLIAALDPQTGLIMGRSPSMVKYLLVKAKQRYALEMHEGLIEELRVARREEVREREKKENVLDEVLRASFGHEAEGLIAPLFQYQPPPSPPPSPDRFL